MSILFSRDTKKVQSSTRKSLKDLIPVENIQQLFQEKKREDLITKIQESLGLDEKLYQKQALTLLHNTARYYQGLPESTLYFSHRGGLLDRALNRTEAALQLLRQILILDGNKTPSEKQKQWLYTLFSAAMLQGVGKLYTDYRVDLYDANTHLVKQWQPLQEDLTSINAYYHYEFLKGDDLTFRNNITPLLARQIMPSSGFAWILSDPDTFCVWLALLQEDKDTAGPLAAILDRANAIAIQREIKDFLLRYQELDARGNRLGAFADGSPETQVNRERLMGAEFITWLISGLETGKILINKTPMLMEILPTGIVMSPQLFDMFAQEHLKFKNKVAVQKAFLAWNLHLLTDAAKNAVAQKDGTNRIHIDTALLPEKVRIDNGSKIRMITTLDLVHNMQQHHFKPNELNSVLNHLSPSGQWVQAEESNLVTQHQYQRSF